MPYRFALLYFALWNLTLAAATGQTLVRYCVTDQAQEDHLRAMMQESLDLAFKNHFAHLFDVWVKQGVGEAGQRAQLGSSNAVESYLRAYRNLQKWNPQRC